MAPIAVSEQQLMRRSGEHSAALAYERGQVGYSAMRRSPCGGTFVALPDEARAVAPPNTPELLNSGLGPCPLPSIPSSLDTIVTQVEFDEIDELTGHNISVEVKLPKANVAELAAAAESGGLLPIELTVEDIADRGLEGVDNASLQRSFALLNLRGGGKESEDEAPILTGLVDASTSTALPLDYDAVAKSRTWRQWCSFMTPAFKVLGFVFLNNFAKVLLGSLIPFVLSDYFGSKREAAMVQTVSDAVRAFIGVLFVPIYGNLLDTIGRHPFFILNASLWALPAAFYIAIPSTPIFYLFFYEVASVFSTSYYLAFIADCYPDSRDRAKAFAIVDGGSLMAYLLAFIGTLVSKETVAWITLGLVLLRVPYACFLFSETLDKHQRKSFSCALFKVNPISAVRVITRNKVLKAVTIVVAGFLITTVGNLEISSYYLQQRLDWTKDDAFLSLVVTGLVAPFLLLVVYPLLSKCVRPSRISAMAYLALMVGTLILVVATAKWQVFAFFVPLSCATNLGFPALLGVFSNAGEGADQGRRLTGIGAVIDFTFAMVPLAIGQMFHALPRTLNWLPFSLCLLASLPGFIICFFFLPKWIAADRKETLAKSFAQASGAPQ